jgi:diguanylate cyclase (GGDEF)-like protein
MGSVDDLRGLAFARRQQQALELIASGAALGRVLELVVSTIELEAPGMRCSVLLLPDGVHMRHGAAPRLGAHYMSLVDGESIGPVAGSCGTAMWLDRRVIVADIATDPLWEPFGEIRALALGDGLRACWSTPLHSSSGRVIGSFAMYYDQPRKPTAGELALADVAGHLSGLAIDHAWASERLRRRAAEQAEVAAIGRRALVSDDDQGLMQELVARVAGVFGGARVALFERTIAGELRLRAAAEPEDEPASTDAVISVEVPGRDSAWGSLEVTHPFGAVSGEEELDFLRSIATVLAAAIDRSRKEEETRYQALHDPLTRLPNRALLMSLLSHALERDRRAGGTLAVLLIDLDNFKLINDTLGHLVGDELLAALAPRLRGVVREADTVGRFGGDEFVVIAEALADEREAVTLAQRLTQALAQPCVIGESVHVVRASIGVAVTTAGQAQPDSLLGDADAAMYHAKRHGTAHQIFDSEMRERAVARLSLQGALRDALEHGELSVSYQRIVSISDGDTVGAEALLRWDAPGWREKPITEVIAAAEDSGLIEPIGAWVLQSSLTALAASGSPPGWLAVNLSAQQVASTALASLVARLLAEHGIEPTRLVLELTETALFNDRGASLSTIHELQRTGVRLALDDFGTGFSSLSHLMRFPIDILKIDRSFIARLPGDPSARAIVSAVTAMAHQLGKPVVAEGVETEAQLASVTELACDCAQGYLLGRPTRCRPSP